MCPSYCEDGDLYPKPDEGDSCSKNGPSSERASYAFRPRPRKRHLPPNIRPSVRSSPFSPRCATARGNNWAVPSLWWVDVLPLVQQERQSDGDWDVPWAKREPVAFVVFGVRWERCEEEQEEPERSGMWQAAGFGGEGKQ